MSDCTVCKTLVAKNPFYFPITGQPLYSYEELCYYLYQYPSFFTKEIVNSSLKNWLLNELDAKELVEKLHRLDREKAIERNYLLTLLTSYSYLPISSIQVILKEYDFVCEKGNWIKKKYYADDLFQVKCYEKAEKLYIELLKEIPYIPENFMWIGQVNYGIASCFAQNMEYEKAATYYHQAYQLTKKKQCKWNYWRCLYLIGDLQAVKEDVKGEQTLIEDYTDFIQEIEEEIEGLFLGETYDIIEGIDIEDSIKIMKRRKIISKWKQQFQKDNIYQYHME